MIKISVALYGNAAPMPPLSAVFGSERRTIGRSEDNFLVLPDPTHEVSRAQAAVWSDGPRHLLVNLSDAMPMRLNGADLAAGQEHEIRAGDQIEVGLYRLEVQQHAPASGAAPGDGAVQALKEALLRGAGIPADAISAELTPELMELLGKLMASSVQGAIDLLALRSLVKQEVKAGVTMVVVRNNNPLKFFPDSQTVLVQMLRKKMPGFMEPLESVEGAYRDLRGHQLGVVAGTRASMDKMMERLSPERVAQQQPAGSLLDSLLPVRRKAALWDLYASRHAALAGDAQDQFKTLFGAAFLAAYEKEVGRFEGGAAHG